MNEERPSSERHGERDSQLSAMFDGELTAAECELLARRLVRDEALRGQWSRYALIGAALRAERGVVQVKRPAGHLDTGCAVAFKVGVSDACLRRTGRSVDDHPAPAATCSRRGGEVNWRPLRAFGK